LLQVRISTTTPVSRDRLESGQFRRAAGKLSACMLAKIGMDHLSPQPRHISSQVRELWR
jgi:hypothetical protein